MATIKCKMCGGDIELSADKTFGTCESCGSTMTLPRVDDEQRAAAFNRGNHFRRIGEFDKALAVYERIVREDDADAEAHWCCALCRFGIEYVEDPATFEWVPTCHRASFDSILEDVDYLAAVDHSDGVTRRQYQKEAARIAEVQRGILATSQKEEPFDVFICYKETEADGQRTRDSIMAQDIYYQLTEQGYRVFFSRITLEDKAGAQYEPYIFAALHSARVMVVVGTSAEHFNAVWVKNEWSRFLSLMKKDPQKLMLPCYRDMDPYDLPEQLSVLQSYDMGKIGFVQDLIRGISKVLNAEQKAAAAGEAAAAQPAGNVNGIALIKRGYMALEDGEWSKADEFFDRALDLDAECAEAYVGKYLVKQQSASLEKQLNRLLSSTEKARRTDLTAVEADAAREQAAVNQYALDGYLSEDQIRQQYPFNRSYPSALADRKRQSQEQKQAFESDRNMSRALRFAKGEYRQALEKQQQAYYQALDARTEAAQKEDEASAAKIRSDYAAHLNAADAAVAKLRQQAEERREADYRDCCARQEQASTTNEWEDLARRFQLLGDYSDSEKRRQQCEDERLRLLDELDRQKHARARELIENRKKRIRRNSLIGAAAAVVIVAIIVLTQVILPPKHYRSAEALLAAGDYDGAVAEFQSAGGYQDAADRVPETRYLHAEALLAEGNRGLAAMAFAKAKNYSDAGERSAALWDEIADRATISAGGLHTVGLKADGTVVAVGANIFGRCDVSDWKDVVAVSAGEVHTVGLKADGTVVAVGSNKYGRCDVSDWKDVVAVSAGDDHTVGLKADGTVVAVGSNKYGRCDVSDWKDVVAVSAGYYHTVGLKADGTVVAVGDNYYGQCDVNDWSDVVAVSAGDWHTVGLKADGTVVAVGSNYSGQCDVSVWKDIVAVSAGGDHTVSLKADGTVVAVGYNEDGQCDVNDWKDVVAVSAGYRHTVGLKADGTVVAVGDNDYGQCDVSDWTEIKVN